MSQSSHVLDTSKSEKLPASSSDTTFKPSIQYLVQGVVKNHSFTHFLFHKIWLCDCVDLDEIAKLKLITFLLSHYEKDYGDFDMFGPMEYAFVAMKILPSGGEASSCVVMQHIHTRRLRKLYVFKTITRDKSLISHPEHGIISDEAYILLGKLKTNLYPHPNIIQLFNCVTSNAVAGIQIHILQMEYCDGGDLWELNNRCIKHGSRMPRSFVAHIFNSLSAALAYLHHGLILSSAGSLKHTHLPDATNRWRTILHNDIKPENIFLRWPMNTPSSASLYPDIVLADFGAAGVESHIKGPRGTYRYSAPEVREAFDASSSLLHRFRIAAANQMSKNVVLTTKSDIWGVGAVMRSLLFEYQRERGGKEWEAKERALQWRELEMVYGETMVMWVRRCLGYTASARPSARTLLGLAVEEVREEAVIDERVQRVPEWIWSREQKI
ncbi:kinase-like protein [Aureobasidium namibiae CBS 147.97]|uniref:Kinase-like protein n=1 Tax=Aureobasidium namibiae CBS 147.97 TaxID=1043004 RepID=A0A074WH64_9PEZI|nr:kinase-like protein [Aureobasidium namibiae CBS 147.97]KEQ70964.1 kinase-like protein [Aureobasidium namibiae CBS 147.97]